MSYFGHRNKFENYFIALGEILTLIALALGCIFILGYAIYQLFMGNFVWFKPIVIGFLLIIIYLLIVYAFSLYERKKKKKK